uniref:PID domain-containing protein n=1 Tax=Anopheles darlingi TaxID=43151 RepID=A0A2M4CGX5_ANODA
MAANRKLFSSKEEIRKEDDDGGGGASDTGGGGGKDEVDYVLTSSNGSATAPSLKAEVESTSVSSKMTATSETPASAPKMVGSTTLDKFNIFHLRRRPKSDPGTGPIGRHAASVATTTAGASPANGSAGATGATGTSGTPAEDGLKKKKSRFVKSASIARIFGNTYNTKKYDDNSALLKLQQFKRSFLSSEKFHKKEGGAGAGEDVANASSTDLQIGDSCYVNDSESSAKAIKSITRGLGRLLRRNCHSIDISRPDPEYKVSYLGNVLTGWAKGDGCVEKPLATLWRNYTQNSKPDVMMKLCLCPSGLKATTRQHGLTEYWSHRITYCSSPKNYPRVFCWIYRHEGRKLKHEFRCHAVICSKENIAQEISTILKENLAKALREFKRDKLNRQNARLSLANSVYDNPSMPRRKIMLSVGANNYRPPLERSKSAPKLMAIEEMIGEEDEEEDAQDEDNHRGAGTTLRSKSTSSTGAGAGLVLEACCREDALFPSTTLGRRRCRRGHSIRRSRLRNSFKSPKDLEAKVPLKNENIVQASPMNKSVDSILDTIGQEAEEEEEEEQDETEAGREQDQQMTPDAEGMMMVRGKSKRSHSSDSSEDDFEAFLAHYNYNSSEPLSTELISYFDMKLNPTAVCSMHDLTQRHHSDLLGSLEPALEDTQRLALSLDDLDHYPLEGLVAQEEEDEDENEKGTGGRPAQTGRHSADAAEEEVFFNQDEVLEMLRTAAESAAGPGNGMGHQYQYHHHHHHHHLHHSHRLSSDPRLSCLHGDDDTAPPSLLCVTSKLNASVGGGVTGASGDGVGGPHHHHHHHHHHPDSDEGSISSGCETSSTVTTNTDDSVATATAPSSSAAALAALSKPCSVLERVRSFEQLAENQVIHVPLGERQSSPAPGVAPVGASGSSGTPQSPVADAMIFKRSITFPAPGIKSNFLMPMAGSGPVACGAALEPIDLPLDSLVDNVGGVGTGHHLLHQYREEHQQRTVSVENSKPKVRHVRLKATAVAAAVNTELINQLQAIDSDSEFSDESGYVEFQDNQPSIKSVTA